MMHAPVAKQWAWELALLDGGSVENDGRKSARVAREGCPFPFVPKPLDGA
jgi:hypothetical protein